MNSSKKFARAFVVQNSGHDFATLKEICEDIIFITNEYHGEDKLLPTIIAGLQEFSPRRDVIVPVGNVYVNLLVGMVAAEMSREWGHFRVALYRDKEYHIQLVEINALGDLIHVFSN